MSFKPHDKDLWKFLNFRCPLCGEKLKCNRVDYGLHYYICKCDHGLLSKSLIGNCIFVPDMFSYHKLSESRFELDRFGELVGAKFIMPEKYEISWRLHGARYYLTITDLSIGENVFSERVPFQKDLYKQALKIINLLNFA